MAFNRNHLTVERSQLVNFTEDLGIGNAGHNRLTQDVITGAVNLQGDLNVATADEIDHNTFTSGAAVLLKLKASNQATIHDNTFTGDGTSAIGIEVLDGSQSVLIANNHIDLTGGGAPIAVYLINQGGVGMTATLRDNVLHAGPAGTGLYANVFTGGNKFQVLAEGNDFRGDLEGVTVNGAGANSDAGQIDLGGGGITSLGTSKGGNDFHGYTGLGGHFAIHLFNSDAATKVFAQSNIIDAGVNPNKVVADSFNGGGTGDVDVSSALDADHAFVQSLYTRLLGRAGSSGELDGWVAALPALGHAGVAHSILFSNESLGRIVDSYYLDYLGRAADAAGRAGWVSAIQQGMSLEAVQAGFLASPEYQGHINTDYVQSLYLNVLHRTGSAAELAGWNNALPQLGLAGVAAAFTTSVEHRVDVTTSYYEDLLGRAPQPGEAAALADGVKGDLLAVEAVILGSGEYYAKG
jgi:hypothetical protein